MHGRKPVVASRRLAAWREQSSVVTHCVPDMTKIIDRSYYTTTIGRILDTFFIFGDRFWAGSCASTLFTNGQKDDMIASKKSYWRCLPFRAIEARLVTRWAFGVRQHAIRRVLCCSARLVPRRTPVRTVVVSLPMSATCSTAKSMASSSPMALSCSCARRGRSRRSPKHFCLGSTSPSSLWRNMNVLSFERRREAQALRLRKS